MKKQWIALLLTLALALPLCVIPALAQPGPEPPPQAKTEEPRQDAEPSGDAGDSAGDAGEPEAPEAPEETEAPDALPPAGPSSSPIVVRPDGTPEASAGGSTMDDELAFTGEDDFRYLAFEDLRDRVLEGSLTAKMLQESIASIDAMDYTDMYQSLNAQMTSLEAAQMMYAQIPVASEMEGAMQGYIISNLASSYASLSATVSDLASGKLQKDNIK